MSEKEDEILTELTVDQIRYIVNKLAAQEIGTFQVSREEQSFGIELSAIRLSFWN